MEHPDWIEQGRRLGHWPVDLDAVLRLVVDGVARQLKGERATLFLVDPGRSQLVSRVGHLGEDHGEIRVGLDEGLVGHVRATGEAVFAAAGDPRVTRRIDELTGFTTRTLVAAPVHGRDGVVVGVLEVLNRRAGRFGREDARRLSAAAEQVGALLRGTSLGPQLGQKRPLAFGLNGLVGDSPALRQVLDRALRAAPSEASVLIAGESGTGKELLARAVHANSARREGPWVKVDCAALPAELVENELFGHERGAYTGADRSAPGKVDAAAGGTLFLDEVAELPLTAQGKLLRLVQDRAYYRVGGTELLSADVRLVAATHRDLADSVEAGAFRQDLYYRLKVVPLTLPPLRDRGAADLDRLIDHFLFLTTERHRRPDLRLSDGAREALRRRPWPGNVRELEHALESAVVLAPGTVIGASDLPPQETRSPVRRPARGQVETLRAVTARYVAWAVEACGGNRSEAARRLDIGRNTLLRKLEEPP